MVNSTEWSGVALMPFFVGGTSTKKSTLVYKVCQIPLVIQHYATLGSTMYRLQTLMLPVQPFTQDIMDTLYLKVHVKIQWTLYMAVLLIDIKDK